MAKERRDDLEKQKQLYEMQSLDAARQMLGFQEKVRDVMEEQLIVQRILIDEKSKGKKLTKDEEQAITNSVLSQRKFLEGLQSQIKLQKQSVGFWGTLNKEINKFHATHVSYFNYLMSADKAIKEISLTLGISSEKSQDIRTAIEGSAIQAARLNMSVEELTSLYSTYVSQVGRTVSLNSEQMEAMAALAKGTGLANNEAALLAGQMELMGRDAVSVNKQVEGILETSERMGVNATKVLKGVSANFKRLQTYTFRQGVQGMGDMAANAEKFRIDVDTALNAAEKSRRLEGAVELAAKLQVLGGEFARSDPFEMLFLSRNDPVKFQKKIAELTKGMATLNKTADGFEFQLASPMARDLLEQAGKALGISTEQMTEMALQQGKLNKMRKDMFSAGYTKDQREILEGLAQMDSSTGKFFVNVKGFRRDIADLTKTELNYLKSQEKSLEERAKAAQTFDDQFKIFMMELKAVGLPLLNGINEILGFVRKQMDNITGIFKNVNKDTKEWMKYIGMGLAGLMAIKPIIGLLSGTLKYLMFIPKGVWNVASSKGVPKTAAQTMTGGAGKGAGMGAFGKGAGIGVAMVGAGAGLMLAAKGITSISTALEKLPEEKIDDLKQLTTTLGIFIGVGAGLGLLAGILGAAAGPMLAFGGAVTLIGAGVGIAAWGIGKMAEGFGDLMKNADPKNVANLAGGMAALATSSALFVNPMSIAGLATMATSIYAMSRKGDEMQKVGSAFANMSAVLKGSKEDYAEIRKTIDSIAKADFSNLKALNNLNQLFSHPLQVEFSNKQVDFIANITLEIDGDRFVEKLNIPRKVEISQRDYQAGYNSPRYS